MRRPLQSLAAALCLAAVTAAPAHAQLLKRIKQAATEKIADKAVDKATGSSSAASGDSASTATAAAPARVNRGSQGVYGTPQPASAGAQSSKVEITGERILAFVDAMEPVIAAGREMRAHRDAEKQVEAYGKCSAIARTKGPGSLTPAQDAESDRLAAQIQALTTALVANGGMRDTMRINATNDSIQVLLDKQQRLIYPAITKCGARPAKQPAPSGITVDFHGTITNPAPKRIAGMTPAQFGRMRERIALYLVDPQRPNDLTPDERGAIDGHAKELADIGAGFRNNLYNWQTWSELWSAWK